MSSNYRKQYGVGARRHPRNIDWVAGQVAFLKTSAAFSRKDYDNLIASRYIHEGATCHPVIVLAANNGQAIVTCVSAHGSGPENNYLAPWKQLRINERFRRGDDFRSFVGSELPANSRHAALRLVPGQQMPKPRASWVNIQKIYCVPFSVLGFFDKVFNIRSSRHIRT